MIIFVVFEAICLFISVMIAKWMVKNRRGLAKNMLIGKDSDADIRKMLEIAVRTFNGEPVQTDLKQYSLNVSIEGNKIIKTEVETDRTRLVYDGNHKTDEQIINKAWTERGAIIFNTVLVWGIIFYFSILVGLLIEICIYGEILRNLG